MFDCTAGFFLSMTNKLQRISFSVQFASVSLSVSVERWCRLRGNLLFYFKSREHLDPAGLIVLDDECSVDTENNEVESTFGIVLNFSGGGFNFKWHCGAKCDFGQEEQFCDNGRRFISGQQQQHLATYTEFERDSWADALRNATHRNMRCVID